jgi:hypothetical protein
MPKDASKTTSKATTTDAEIDSPEDDLVTIDFEGVTFSIPRDADNWSSTAELARLRAIQSGSLVDWLSFMETLVGPARWTVLLQAAPTRADLYRLMSVISTAVKDECQIN